MTRIQRSATRRESRLACQDSAGVPAFQSSFRISASFYRAQITLLIKNWARRASKPAKARNEERKRCRRTRRSKQGRATLLCDPWARSCQADSKRAAELGGAKHPGTVFGGVAFASPAEINQTFAWLFTDTPASVSIAASSPDWNISRTMSQPPTNSPLT